MKRAAELLEKAQDGVARESAQKRARWGLDEPEPPHIPADKWHVDIIQQLAREGYGLQTMIMLRRTCRWFWGDLAQLRLPAPCACRRPMKHVCNPKWGQFYLAEAMTFLAAGCSAPLNWKIRWPVEGTALVWLETLARGDVVTYGGAHLAAIHSNAQFSRAVFERLYTIVLKADNVAALLILNTLAPFDDISEYLVAADKDKASKCFRAICEQIAAEKRGAQVWRLRILFFMELMYTAKQIALSMTHLRMFNDICLGPDQDYVAETYEERAGLALLSLVLFGVQITAPSSSPDSLC